MKTLQKSIFAYYFTEIKKIALIYKLKLDNFYY